MWRGVVAFLKWKPGSRLTISILVAGLVLMVVPAGFAVFHLGRLLVPGHVLENNSNSQSAQETRNANLGQHNLLLVLVNDLKQPDLEGVWLVVNGSLNNGSKFLPVEYQAEVETGKAGSSPGLVEVDGVLAEKFIDDLISRGLWWDYYLVIDQTGLGVLTGWSVTSGNSDFLANSSTQGGNSTENADAQGIYRQAATLRALCERSTLINQTLEPETVLSLLEGHFRTDYDLSRLAAEWYSFRHRGFAWYCEFPTINEVGFLSIDHGE